MNLLAIFMVMMFSVIFVRCHHGDSFPPHDENFPPRDNLPPHGIFTPYYRRRDDSDSDRSNEKHRTRGISSTPRRQRHVGRLLKSLNILVLEWDNNATIVEKIQIDLKEQEC